MNHRRKDAGRSLSRRARRLGRRASGSTLLLLCTAAGLSAAAGCGGSLPGGSDPALNKKPYEFAQDAELRHPFKADAPVGGEARGRAMVNYGSDKLEISNLSDEDWKDVEVWLNRTYVVYVPAIPKYVPGTPTTVLRFKMIYDGKGNPFPADNMPDENRIHQLEIYRGGKMYTLKLDLAD